MTKELCQIFRLDNPIQNYAWGSHTAIAGLMGAAGPTEQPQAELWMGAHPKAPSWADVGGQRMPMTDLIESHPEAILGTETAHRFNRCMPFLFKVLAAAEPLSIQAHPDKNQARSGFARENRLGIPIEAPHRSYRDDSHKPEIICALTPFWGLNGFQPIAAIARNLYDYAPTTLAALAAGLDASDASRSLEIFFETLLAMPAKRRHDVIAEVRAQARNKMASEPAADWVRRLHAAYPGDIGVLSPIYLNLIRLMPGQAMYLEAGQLHAYLEGVGIELMANSDNVLRGGLTPKHIDVPELMRVLRFVAGEPRIITPRPVTPNVHVYDAAVEEFELARLDITAGHRFTAASQRSVEILLAVEGTVAIETEGGQMSFQMSKGESVMIPACLSGYGIQGEGQLFRAAVPASKAG